MGDEVAGASGKDADGGSTRPDGTSSCGTIVAMHSGRVRMRVRLVGERRRAERPPWTRGRDGSAGGVRRARRPAEELRPRRPVEQMRARWIRRGGRADGAVEEAAVKMSIIRRAWSGGGRWHRDVLLDELMPLHSGERRGGGRARVAARSAAGSGGGGGGGALARYAASAGVVGVGRRVRPHGSRAPAEL